MVLLSEANPEFDIVLGASGDFGIFFDQVVEGNDRLHYWFTVDLAFAEQAPADHLDAFVVPIGMVWIGFAVGSGKDDPRPIHMGFGSQV